MLEFLQANTKAAHVCPEVRSNQTFVRPAVNQNGDRTVAIARQIVAELCGSPGERSIAIRYWDGSMELPADGVASCTLVLRGPQVLRRLLLRPSELAFAEAYLRNDFDIVGDMEAAVAIAFGAAQRIGSPRTLARLARLALQLPAGPQTTAAPGPARSNLLFGHAHSRGRDAAAIRRHYDVGNDFYRLWLDQRLVYSCAYFETEAADIDTAQAAKLEHICRKLRLRPGERLLDIGCGWGGLITYAAEHHGVEAVGITLSVEQASLTRERIAAAGLSGRCRVEVCDYRDIPDAEQFDKIASVGMVEHVGHRQFPAYFGHAYRSLRPGGLLFTQGIVRAPVDPVAPRAWLGRRLWHEDEFIYRYVFPNGELVPLAHMIDAAEQTGFETRDVESLREL